MIPTLVQAKQPVPLLTTIMFATRLRMALGVYGYAEIRVNRTQPTITLTQVDDKVSQPQAANSKWL